MKTSLKRILFAGCFGIFCSIFTPLSQANEATRVEEVIKWFGNALYRMAETEGGNPEQWRDLEAKALSKLNKVISENPDSLTQPGRNKATPLTLAAARGYAFFIREMLKHPDIRSTLDRRDGSGMSAADHALIALRQSVFACSPEALNNPFAMIPIIVVLPYYEQFNPYQKVVEILADAGAYAEPDRAKAHWLKTCKSADPATVEVISESNQLQTDLIRLGKVAVLDFQRHQKEQEIQKIIQRMEKDEGEKFSEERKDQLMKLLKEIMN